MWTGSAILVEAKSHVHEMYGNGCQASPKSRKLIDKALSEVKDFFDIPQETDWTGPLYQSANRLAHLYFFREICRIPAWLANVYFADDPHSPTSAKTWAKVLPGVKRELGLGDREAGGLVEVILPSGD
ncbi:MAG: hypothetical protein JEZ02_14420 [Desulfatibacillum sp.]|nr:hypothetical protein [Desulfatibacillum sp.]